MVFESKHPLVKHKLTLLRNVDTKPKKFRELIREISMLLCYEATADLGLEPIVVDTPMGTAPTTWPVAGYWSGMAVRLPSPT